MIADDPQRKEKLSRLIALIGGIVALVGAFLLCVIAFAGWSANFASLTQERQLIENQIDQQIARILSEQTSIALWDPAVVATSPDTFDDGFVEREFGIFFSDTYGHDEVFVFAPDGRPTFAFVNGERRSLDVATARRSEISAIVDHALGDGGERLKERPSALFEDIRNAYANIENAGEYSRWSGHLMNVDSQPAFVGGLTILPPTDRSLLNGPPSVLVSINYVRGSFIDGVGEVLLLPDLRLVDSPPGDSRLGTLPLVTDDGVMSGYLAWTTRRPGQMLLTTILPLGALVVVLAGLLSAFMFQRLRRAHDELSTREADAWRQARSDALSGLPNRTHFIEELGRRLETTSSSQSVLVAYIDIDRFKVINDTMGHEAGDHLVRQVSERLTEFLPGSDFVARFGGDEFAVLRSTRDDKDGDKLSDVLKRAFADPFQISVHKTQVTASIGVASAPRDGTTIEQLMRNADIALYESKNNGRDRATVFVPRMAQRISERRAIELELRDALENDRLALAYQPIVSSESSEVDGVEALLRWTRDDGSSVSPADFIPIAEEVGMMPSLGAWVIDRALEDARRWPDLKVSVNLSPAQFNNVDLSHQIHDASQAWGIHPSRVVFEITEGVLLDASAQTRSTLGAIREMGFEIALDDFGTGFSSLQYLSEYEFDKIKIDRSFVQGISKSRRSLTIAQAVVSIGRGLGMNVVAEGVENQADAAVVQLLGCTQFQGFHLYRPLAADRIDVIVKALGPVSHLPARQAAAFDPRRAKAS